MSEVASFLLEIRIFIASGMWSLQADSQFIPRGNYKIGVKYYVWP